MDRWVPAEALAHPDMRDALVARDVAKVYRTLQRFGVSQRKIAALCGQNQSEVSEILSGRRVVSIDVLDRIERGLSVRFGDHPDEEQPMARILNTGVDREVAGVWPTRSAMPRDLWMSLISDATTDLFFGGYTSYFLWLEQPQLRAALRTKCEQGVRVRFLLGDVTSPVTLAREQVEATPLTITARVGITLKELSTLEGVEVRFSDRHISMSVWDFRS
jgi:transcriptional regulator with XRE-family HTH domain